MRFSLMTYNVLHGFHQLASPYALERERLALAQQVVRDANPDVLVLTEACYGGENPYGKRLDYAKEFGYPFEAWCQWGVHEWGTSVLSKFPLTCECVPLADRAAVRAQLSVENKDVLLDGVHFSPFLTERQKVGALRTFIPRDDKPYLLTGDFNALSAADNYSLEGLDLFAKKYVPGTTSETLESLRKPSLVPSILARGLQDVGAVNPQKTFPTKLLDAAGPLVRIDYVFASHHFRVVDVHAIRSLQADSASDHYPVIATLELLLVLLFLFARTKWSRLGVG